MRNVEEEKISTAVIPGLRASVHVIPNAPTTIPCHPIVRIAMKRTGIYAPIFP